jgi:hypothetical protein
VPRQEVDYKHTKQTLTAVVDQEHNAKQPVNQQIMKPKHAKQKVD